MIYALVITWTIGTQTAYTFIPYDTKEECEKSRAVVSKPDQRAVCRAFAADPIKSLRKKS